MLITVNAQPYEIAPGTTVAALLARLDLLGKPSAVEVNKRLVAKGKHAVHELAEGDSVEVVTLVGGG